MIHPPGPPPHQCQEVTQDRREKASGGQELEASGAKATGGGRRSKMLSRVPWEPGSDP